MLSTVQSSVLCMQANRPIPVSLLDCAGILIPVLFVRLDRAGILILVLFLRNVAVAPSR